jgi:aspartate/methionine/tyrosine aminotransferase
MFEVSEMVKRIQGSERSQRKSTVPEGAVRMDKGEPDFPTPVHIQEAATRAMRDNFTHYVNPYGDGELREAICMTLKKNYGVERSPENVLVTAGGIEAIHVISATYLNPGDEALVFDPGYSAYADSIALFGGKPVFVPLTDRFHLDVEAIQNRISDRTKIAFLASPSNPTAAVLTEEEIRGLARVALEHDLLLIIDEVYHRLRWSRAFFHLRGRRGEGPGHPVEQFFENLCNDRLAGGLSGGRCEGDKRPRRFS